MKYDLSEVLLCENISLNKKEWDNIEKQYNIIFPEDYKEFIDTYDVGAINNFLWILSPFCSNDNLNSICSFKEMKSAYETLKKEFPEDFKYNFYDNGEGLFPWGVTDNGEEMYWNYHNGTQELVLMETRDDGIEVYDMSMTEFLYKVLSEKIICSILVDDFVLEKNYYKKYLK